MKCLYEITETDVGKKTIKVGRALRTTFSLVGTLGTVQPSDVGKRVFLAGGIGSSGLRVENNQQRDRRQAEERLRQAVQDFIHDVEWGPDEIDNFREEAHCVGTIDRADAFVIVADEWSRFFDR